MSDDLRQGSWRRFERSGRGQSEARFWELCIDGPRLLLRFGPVSEAGSEAQGDGPVDERTLSFPDEAAARRSAKKKIRTKLRAGWIEVAVERRAPPQDMGAKLEAEIAEDPNRLEPWLVYADYLTQIEPVLGERVALSLARAQTKDARQRGQIDARIAELEARHRRELLGPSLAGVVAARRHEGVFEFEWLHAMILGATLIDLGTMKFDALVGALLEQSAARILRTLTVVGDEARPDAFAAALEQLGARDRPHLRALVLDGHGRGARSYPYHPAEPGRRVFALPRLASLLARMPKLERLGLRVSFGSAPLEHATLRELSLCRVDEDSALSLRGWRLPQLHSLRVLASGGPMDLSEAQLPGLRRLVIDAGGRGDELLAGLAGWEQLGALETLVVTGSWLTTEGARWMMENAALFGGIGELVCLDASHDVAVPAGFSGVLGNVEIDRGEIDRGGGSRWREDRWAVLARSMRYGEFVAFPDRWGDRA